MSREKGTGLFREPQGNGSTEPNLMVAQYLICDVSCFLVEGDSFLLSGRTVGIMLPLSEVKRTESGAVAEVAYDQSGSGLCPRKRRIAHTLR